MDHRETEYKNEIVAMRRWSPSATRLDIKKDNDFNREISAQRLREKEDCNIKSKLAPPTSGLDVAGRASRIGGSLDMDHTGAL